MLRNIRNCHSAADVHDVGNIRNVAEGIKSLVDDPEFDRNCLIEMLERIEQRQVQFFKKKFQHLK